MLALRVVGLLVLVAAGGWTSDASQRVFSALSCAPQVHLATTMLQGDNTGATGMHVVVSAQASVSGGDKLTRIAFTGARGARVEVNGQNVSLPSTINLQPSTAAWSFVVRGTSPGQPYLVNFVARDLCGDAAKFVGAGTTAAAGGSQYDPTMSVFTPVPTTITTPTPTPTTSPITRTFFVSKSGSDSNDGSSPGKAWRTFAAVRAGSIQAGSTILAEAGSAWNETVRLRANNLKLGVYGIGARPKIVAQDGQYALDASGYEGIEIDGWEFTSATRRSAEWGIVRLNGDGYVVRHVMVHGADGHMFHASGARGLVEESEFYDNGSSGPQTAVVISGYVEPGYPDTTAVTIFRNNYVHDTQYRALASWGTNIRFENNLIERWTNSTVVGNATQAPAGIYLAGRYLGDVVVTNNRVLGSGVEYWGIWVDTGPEHRAIVENNLVSNGTRCFWAEKTDNVLFRNNTCAQISQTGVQWGSSQYDPEDAADNGEIHGNTFVGAEPADGWIKIQVNGSATVGTNNYIP